MLQSWTSSISSGVTWSTTCVQLLMVARSGTSPPASIAVPAPTRSNEAEPAVSANDVSASAASTGCSDTLPASATGCASLVCPNVMSSGIATSSGRGADSASASGA